MGSKRASFVLRSRRSELCGLLCNACLLHAEIPEILALVGECFEERELGSLCDGEAGALRQALGQEPSEDRSLRRHARGLCMCLGDDTNDSKSSLEQSLVPSSARRGTVAFHDQACGQFKNSSCRGCFVQLYEHPLKTLESKDCCS